MPKIAFFVFKNILDNQNKCSYNINRTFVLLKGLKEGREANVYYKGKFKPGDI